MIQITFTFNSLRSLIAFTEKHGLDIDGIGLGDAPLVYEGVIKYDQDKETAVPAQPEPEIPPPEPLQEEIQEDCDIPPPEPEPEPPEPTSGDEQAREPEQIQPPIESAIQPDVPETRRSVSVSQPVIQDKEDDMPTARKKHIYIKKCVDCGEEFESTSPNGKRCDACKKKTSRTPRKTASAKSAPAAEPPKPAPAKEEPQKKVTRCLRCGSHLSPDTDSKLCYNCGIIMRDSGKPLSDNMRAEVEKAIAFGKVSKVCGRCHNPFFTVPSDHSTYCEKCMEKLRNQPSELTAKKTGFFGK